MHEATFPILADPEKSACDAFGVLSPMGYAQRITVYIDKEGVIQKIDRQVNPMKAGVQLVENMESLGFPRLHH